MYYTKQQIEDLIEQQAVALDEEDYVTAGEIERKLDSISDNEKILT